MPRARARSGLGLGFGPGFLSGARVGRPKTDPLHIPIWKLGILALKPQIRLD